MKILAYLVSLLAPFPGPRATLAKQPVAPRLPRLAATTQPLKYRRYKRHALPKRYRIDSHPCHVSFKALHA